MKSMTKLMIVAMVLIAAALVVAPATARTAYTDIENGDTIYAYELGIDFVNLEVAAGDTVTKIARLKDDDFTIPVPVELETPIDLTGGLANNFDVLPAYFSSTGGHSYGKYFVSYAVAGYTLGDFIYIQQPTLTADVVLDSARTNSLNGKSIARGNDITFKVLGSTGMKDSIAPPLTTYYGKVQVLLTTPGGAKTTFLGGVDMRNIDITGPQIFVADILAANAIGAGTEAGQYSGVVQWTAPAGLSAYKTDLQSNSFTFTVESQVLKVESNKDTVIRNNRFVLTISGEANHDYFMYVSNANLPVTDYPTIAPDQPGVSTADWGAAIPISVGGRMGRWSNTWYGSVTSIAGGNNWGLRDEGFMLNQGNMADIPLTNLGATFRAGICYVTTTASGTRPIEWITNAATDERTFTFKVVDYDHLTYGTGAARYDMDTMPFPPAFAVSPKTDSVKVKVEQGGVTITASGDQAYFLGEEVIFSGTNTDGPTVYLFITGPNLPVNGGYIEQPTNAVLVGVRTPIDVETDDTWEYKWDTNQKDIDAGTYTIYATNLDVTKAGLGNANVLYDSVSVVVKKPFVTAKPSANTVARGDELVISGQAEGNPPAGLRVWILGKNYFGPGAVGIFGNYGTVSVEDDGSYEYKVTRATTGILAAGQYYVIVQHPMYNGVFDVRTNPVGAQNFVQKSDGTGAGWVNEFVIDGTSSLQGSDAAQALEDVMNVQYIDDYPAKTAFLVEEAWIRINEIGTKSVGSTFTVTGETNLAVGDELLIDIYSSSFDPTKKTETGEFSGTSRTVEVVEGDAYNAWSVEVDATTFKPDEYIISVESVEAGVTSTGLFNVVAATPTPVPTTATTTSTATATATATAVPPTTTTPGFGVLIALAGLGAVAFLVMRKH